MVSTIAAVQSPRFQKISDLMEDTSTHLFADPPNYKQAWRAMLSAVEGLLGLMFPYVPMTVDEIKRHSAAHHSECVSGGRNRTSSRTRDSDEFPELD
jgi:hypothetical protein